MAGLAKGTCALGVTVAKERAFGGGGSDPDHEVPHFAPPPPDFALPPVTRRMHFAIRRQIPIP